MSSDGIRSSRTRLGVSIEVRSRYVEESGLTLQKTERQRESVCVCMCVVCVCVVVGMCVV